MKKRVKAWLDRWGTLLGLAPVQQCGFFGFLTFALIFLPMWYGTGGL
jgi:hypothetical protein